MTRSPLYAVFLAAAFLAAGPIAGLAEGQAEGSQASPPPEWVSGQMDVTFLDLTDATVRGAFHVHLATLQGSPASAQDLRNAYANVQQMGQGAAYVKTMESSLAQRIQGELTGVLPASQVQVTDATVDLRTLQAAPGPDPYHPPVDFTFNATIAIDLAQLSHSVLLTPELARTALDVGAAFSAPYDLVADPGWNVTFTFAMPPGLVLDQAAGAQLSPDGATARWDLANWRSSSPQRLNVSVALRSAGAPRDVPTDAQLALDIDMADVSGLSIPGLLGGDFGKLDVAFHARLLARSLRLADFPALQKRMPPLPDSLSLPGFNADGLRLAVKEGLVPPGALDDLQAALETLARDRVSALAQGPVELQGGLAPGALDAANISTPLDGDPPIVYEASSSFQIPLAREASHLGAAVGPALLTRTMSFALPKLQGFDTTYRIVLPAGIAVQGVQATGATVQRDTQGGRDVILVTPSDDQAQATFTVAVSAEFAVIHFWYMWLGIVIVVALLAVALAVRRRRRRAKPAGDEPQGEPVDPTAGVVEHVAPPADSREHADP